MKVLVQAGIYQCGECADRLLFEPVKLSESSTIGIGYCPNGDAYSNITGELLRKGCSRYNVRLKVPIQVIECEVAD